MKTFLTYWTLACLIGYAFCVSDPVIDAYASREVSKVREYHGKCSKCHEYQRIVWEEK